jgi:hypothetical protein
MGPKLIMIIRMLAEFIVFVIVFAAFIFAFGIALQSITYHNQPLNIHLLRQIFIRPYLVTAGQYQQLSILLGSMCARVFCFESAASLVNKTFCFHLLTKVTVVVK